MKPGDAVLVRGKFLRWLNPGVAVEIASLDSAYFLAEHEILPAQERVSVTEAGYAALLRKYRFKRFPDRCYAVVSGNRRGPCGNSKRTALARFLGSGFIKSSRED